VLLTAKRLGYLNVKKITERENDKLVLMSSAVLKIKIMRRQNWFGCIKNKTHEA
jgi:hypothetical protein